MKTEPSERLQDTFDFMEFWRALKRRRHIIWAITAVLFVLAVIYCATATRRYSATGTIELKSPSPDSLGLNASLGVNENGSVDTSATGVEGQTEAAKMQSSAVGLRLIEELHLENSPDFKGGGGFNPIGMVLSLFNPSKPPVSSGVIGGTPRFKPDPRQGVLGPFEANLKVTPTPGTRLISVTYLSKDPQTAKAVVDQLMADAVNASSAVARGEDPNSSKFIDDQLSDIRAQTERLQGQVAKMQQQAGIISLGSPDGGKDQAYSEILTELEQVGATLGQAQTNRILKGAAYEQIVQGNPELISASSGSLNFATSPGIASSLGTIQSLRLQMTTDQAQLAQLEAKFGPAYPKLEETRMRVARYEQQIHDEIARMRERAKNDYDVAVKTEQAARATYAKLKSQAEAVSNSAMGFAIAREEADSSRKLYENLLSRSKEAEIIQGLKPSTIGIVSPALLPGGPATPPVQRILLSSLILGLTMGAGLALLTDLFDRRILSYPAVAGDFGRSPLGGLPVQTAAELDGISASAGSRSAYAEEMRSLANSLFLSRGATPPKVIAVTSPGEGDGKTTTSANLAMLLAQQGKTVLLVDADLRKPGVLNALKLDPSRGLANLLTSNSADTLTEIRAVASQPGLSVLSSGDASLLSPEAFSLPRFGELFEEFRQNFDCVVVDTAAVLSANESIAVTGQADVVLLVARLYKTKAAALREAIAKLEHFVHADVLKLVINGVGKAPGTLGIYNGDIK